LDRRGGRKTWSLGGGKERFLLKKQPPGNGASPGIFRKKGLRKKIPSSYSESGTSGFLKEEGCALRSWQSQNIHRHRPFSVTVKAGCPQRTLPRGLSRGGKSCGTLWGVTQKHKYKKIAGAHRSSQRFLPGRDRFWLSKRFGCKKKILGSASRG